MKDLIQIEWFKLKRLTAAKIILACYIVLVPLWMYVYHYFMQGHPGLKMILEDPEKLYSFPTVWKFELWCAGLFNILLGVIIVLITTNEIQFKTQRQNVIDGLSKRQVILSRFIDICLLSAFVTVLNVIVTLVTAFIFSDNPGNPFNGIHVVPVFFLQTLAYFSVAFLISALLKRAAISILVFIFIYPAEWIGSQFLPMEYQGFMPLRAMSRLVPSPFQRLTAMFEANAAGIKNPWIEPFWMYVVTVLILTALIYTITYRLLLRRDL